MNRNPYTYIFCDGYNLRAQVVKQLICQDDVQNSVFIYILVTVATPPIQQVESEKRIHMHQQQRQDLPWRWKCRLHVEKAMHSLVETILELRKTIVSI